MVDRQICKDRECMRIQGTAVFVSFIKLHAQEMLGLCFQLGFRVDAPFFRPGTRPDAVALV